jgi:AcrR family transcriptional regulator
MDTAERLFGEYGYSAVSLRHIISEAQVNLAAIHYHFGSKLDLLDQVILRKVGPINERRMQLLDQFEAESAPASAPVEKILEAFIAPAILIEKSPEFVKLMGRAHAEGLMPEIVQRHFQPIFTRFMAAMRHALPEVSEKELLWKAHFAIGAMAHTLTARPDLIPHSEQESPLNVSKMLVAFVSSGFCAPATLEKETEVNR